MTISGRPTLWIRKLNNRARYKGTRRGFLLPRFFLFHFIVGMTTYDIRQSPYNENCFLKVAGAKSPLSLASMWSSNSLLLALRDHVYQYATQLKKWKGQRHGSCTWRCENVLQAKVSMRRTLVMSYGDILGFHVLLLITKNSRRPQISQKCTSLPQSPRVKSWGQEDPAEMH